MQRHWNNDVGRMLHAVVRCCKCHKSQRQTQMGEPVVFERVNQLAQRPFIEEVSPGDVKVGRPGQTGAAAVIISCSGVGDSAERAEW